MAILTVVVSAAGVTPAQLAGGEAHNRELRRTGKQRRSLRDVTNLDHLQADNYLWECPPDPSGAEPVL